MERSPHRRVAVALALAVAWPAPALSGAAAPKGSPCVPAAVDDIYIIDSDVVLAGTVTTNDTTCEFAVSLLTAPSHGVLSQFSPRGVFGYTPDPGFAGTDSFTYRLGTDQPVESALVTITVLPCVPVAVDDSYMIEAGTTLTANVTDNDATCGLSVDSVTAPVHGAGDGGPDGTFTYTPDPEFAGTDSFTYRLGGDTSPATADVTIDVVLVATSTSTSSTTTLPPPATTPAPDPPAPTSTTNGTAPTTAPASNTTATLPATVAPAGGPNGLLPATR